VRGQHVGTEQLVREAEQLAQNANENHSG